MGETWGSNLAAVSRMQQVERKGRGEPFTELLGRDLESLLGAIFGIYLGMDYVGIGEEHDEQIVNVSGKALEAGLAAHEAMDVDQEELPATTLFRRLVGNEGLSRGPSWVAIGP